MIGRRIYDTDIFEAGDYGRHPEDNNWYACTPNGHLANLVKHSVTEHEDKTITVHPSILVTMKVNKQDKRLYHGHLVRGIWK